MAKQEKVSKAKIMLESLLEEVVTSVKSAKDLASEHAPDIAKEIIDERAVFLKFRLIDSYFGLGVSLLGILVGITIPMIIYSTIGFSGGAALIAIMSGVVGVVAVVMTLISISSIIETYSSIEQLKVAPKKEVLDYLRRLVR